MAENLMNSDHKATNDKYRDNYDRIFNRIFIGSNETYKSVADARENVGPGKTIFVLPSQDTNETN